MIIKDSPHLNSLTHLPSWPRGILHPASSFLSSTSSIGWDHRAPCHLQDGFLHFFLSVLVHHFQGGNTTMAASTPVQTVRIIWGRSINSSYCEELRMPFSHLVDLLRHRLAIAAFAESFLHSAQFTLCPSTCTHPLTHTKLIGQNCRCTCNETKLQANHLKNNSFHSHCATQKQTKIILKAHTRMQAISFANVRPGFFTEQIWNCQSRNQTKRDNTSIIAMTFSKCEN